MSWFYRRLIRPALFTRDSEAVHNFTLGGLARVGRSPASLALLEELFGAPALPVDLFGLRFPNPVGLAAGMDKKAAALPAWERFGFGFSEIGGATRHAQEGNPAPRMFRAVAHEALVNRMGFNNPGAEAIAEELIRWKLRGAWPGHPVGANLGKSKITPLEEAAADYSHSFRLLWPHCDFFVVNVSSPNTPNLRQLQDGAALEAILRRLQADNAEFSKKTGSPVRPLLVKVAPDLAFEALDEILALATPCGLAGIVATNTTLARPAAATPESARVLAEAGGLSGRPLAQRSTEIIRHIFRQTRGTLPVIGVGGIFSAADAWEKIAAGASLVQVYTGLVYQGPSIARDIVTGLRERLRQAGLTRISEATGMQAG